jgi:hypothetical protein
MAVDAGERALKPALRVERRLRREHWRTQRYGPGRSLARRILIPSTYAAIRVRPPANYELPL